MGLLQIILLLIALTAAQDVDYNCKPPNCVRVEIGDINLLQDGCPYMHLSISNQIIKYISIGAFVQCTVTEVLDLTNNEINSLRSGSFVGLNSLVQLYIENNNIEEIEAGAFHALERLDILVLTGNQILTIPEYEFIGSSLRFLNLHNNKLKYISTCMINMQAVESVDVSSNEIENINSGALINVEPGVIINFSNNRIRTLGLSFKESFSSTESKFYASGNLLEAIDSTTLGDLHKLNLATLDLNFNRIKFIAPDVFLQYPLIKQLSLGYNQLYRLDPNILCGLDSLEELDLSGNGFTTHVFDLLLPDSIHFADYSDNNLDQIMFGWVLYSKMNNVRIKADGNVLDYFGSSAIHGNIVEASIANNYITCSKLHAVFIDMEERGVVLVKGGYFGIDSVNGIRCAIDYNHSQNITNNSHIEKIPRKQG